MFVDFLQRNENNRLGTYFEASAEASLEKVAFAQDGAVTFPFHVLASDGEVGSFVVEFYSRRLHFCQKVASTELLFELADAFVYFPHFRLFRPLLWLIAIFFARNVSTIVGSEIRLLARFCDAVTCSDFKNIEGLKMRSMF